MTKTTFAALAALLLACGSELSGSAPTDEAEAEAAEPMDLAREPRLEPGASPARLPGPQPRPFTSGGPAQPPAEPAPPEADSEPAVVDPEPAQADAGAAPESPESDPEPAPEPEPVEDPEPAPLPLDASCVSDEACETGYCVPVSHPGDGSWAREGFCDERPTEFAPHFCVWLPVGICAPPW